MHALDPSELISAFGTIGIIAVIFAESCFAFFLPGDSLLFTAGLLAAQGRFGLNAWVIGIGCSIAAIAGNQVGYVTGRKAGPALFRRPDSRFFKQEHLERTHQFFDKYGPKTIVLARFVPIVRTFACIVAGAGKMQYRLFLTYNIIGGVLWAMGLTMVGWLFGKSLPDNFNVDKYLLPVILVIIVISFIPAIVEVMKARRKSRSQPNPNGTVGNVIEDEIAPE